MSRHCGTAVWLNESKLMLVLTLFSYLATAIHQLFPHYQATEHHHFNLLTMLGGSYRQSIDDSCHKHRRVDRQL